MTTTPRLGITELAEAQYTPEQAVNEAIRFLEAGAGAYQVKDRNLATPPGSPSDGDRYIVGASGTGAWSGHDGEIAFYASGWLFITVKEGFVFWVEDENVLLVYNGSSYQTIGTGAGGQALPLTFNFTDAADALFYADEAMTLTQQATSGTLTIAYEKSTNAAPSTFSSTTSPITLEAGAWLKVTASSVTAPAAVHLKRTA